MSFSNKVFIVTGSARGVGAGIAENILQNGGRVTISDVLNEVGLATTDRLAKLYGTEKVTFIHCDVTNQQSFESLWSETEKIFGSPVQVLVNNAGVFHNAGWEKCIDINLKGLMIGNYLALDRMGKTKGHGLGGQVINVASLAGFVAGSDAISSPYFASKAGVISLTKSIGNDLTLRTEGVRVNAICMGYTDTGLFNKNKQLNDQILEEVGGTKNLLPVSRIVDAFQVLMSNGKVNGRSLCVMANIPMWYYPRHDRQEIIFWACGAKLFKRLRPNAMVMEPWHQAVFFIGFQLFLFIALQTLWRIFF
ncbi:hypothetical protein TCAL_07592 [Tigriopus californicus]|uniref:15-hydroxyprostaglandin dehydrogenase [NAD(+)] n=2 Tax=Tigriopus californicus TaxID=6832 RepID=A0A553PGA4_TIGCA|nr:hypothetical protein TCAL_07592 [Tigriopus californicus]